MREDADQILLDAAAAGAELKDLKLLADAAWEQWKSQRPDPDDDGFDDRYLRLGTTLDGAGRLTGNLTPNAPPRSRPSSKPSVKGGGRKTPAPPPSGSTTPCKKAVSC